MGSRSHLTAQPRGKDGPTDESAVRPDLKSEREREREKGRKVREDESQAQREWGIEEIDFEKSTLLDDY